MPPITGMRMSISVTSGSVLLVQLHRFDAGGGFGHHLHVGLRLDDGADADAGDEMILGDQHADWRGRHRW